MISTIGAGNGFQSRKPICGSIKVYERRTVLLYPTLRLILALRGGEETEDSTGKVPLQHSQVVVTWVIFICRLTEYGKRAMTVGKAAPLFTPWRGLRQLD